jgi:hypothetical protein
MANGNIWPSPSGSGQQQLYDFCKRLALLLTTETYKDYTTRSITLTAGTTTSVAWAGMSADHRVSITPTSSAAAALSPYVSARTAGTGFTLTHGAAAGTETFDCIVIR